MFPIALRGCESESAHQICFCSESVTSAKYVAICVRLGLDFHHATVAMQTKGRPWGTTCSYSPLDLSLSGSGAVEAVKLVVQS